MFGMLVYARICMYNTLRSKTLQALIYFTIKSFASCIARLINFNPHDHFITYNVVVLIALVNARTCHHFRTIYTHLPYSDIIVVELGLIGADIIVTSFKSKGASFIAQRIILLSKTPMRGKHLAGSNPHISTPNQSSVSSSNRGNLWSKKLGQFARFLSDFGHKGKESRRTWCKERFRHMHVS